MTLDARHVENLASLLETQGAKSRSTPSFRAIECGQRDMLELLTAAEATVFRRDTGIALYLRPDRFDLQFATMELAQDMQTPSKLSMPRLRRIVRYLLGAADVGTFFAYQDESNAVLVWTDDDWSGNSVTCKSTPAGAVQLGSHTIETCRSARLKVSSTRSDQMVLENSKSNTSCWKSSTPRRPGDVKMTICTDSDAARGMILRVGCGRVRHLETRYLWHQQALRE